MWIPAYAALGHLEDAIDLSAHVENGVRECLHWTLAVASRLETGDYG